MSDTAPSLETPVRLLHILAHPAMERSRANRAMVDAVKAVPGVTFVDLYETYPDFVIDVWTEQRRLVSHDIVALQFPFYWYSTPALLKEWFDLVWLHGFAYGVGGTALEGKRLLVACTTGADETAYQPVGANRFTVEEFLRPLEQTAALCGLQWLEPFVLHAAASKSQADIERETRAFRLRLAGLVRGGSLQ